MSLWNKIKNNLDDVSAFGPQILRRHISHATGAKTARIKIPGFGHFRIRPSESDILVMRQVFIDQEYKPGIVGSNRLRARYQDILKSQQIPVIVDAGANIGLASLWFAQTYPGAVVQAVEPEPSNIEMLYLNFGRDTRVNILPMPSDQGQVSSRLQRNTRHGVPGHSALKLASKSLQCQIPSPLQMGSRLSLRSISKGSKAICLEKTWRGLMMSLLSTLSRTIGC